MFIKKGFYIFIILLLLITACPAPKSTAKEKAVQNIIHQEKQIMSTVESEKLELKLSIQEETTGSSFNLSLPVLKLEIYNKSDLVISIPREGYSLVFSVHLEIEGNNEIFHRGAAGSGKVTPILLADLSPGKSVYTSLSPLELGPGEEPLPVGEYTAKAYVLTEAQLGSASDFAREWGGLVSNTVQFTVTAK